MDIKRMHEMIECLSECAKHEFSKGVENVDTCEMGKVTDMLKDLSEAMYYRTLTKVMEESENDEIMEMFDRYGNGRRFYDHYRYANGRFAPKGHGTYRRGYDEPPYYHMTPEMYREHDPKYYRDMDKMDGKMYYTESMHSGSRYETAKRGYEESKQMHKANTPEDKQAKMKELESYMKELSEDVTKLIVDATPEEKAVVKNKMQVLMQKM